MTGDILSAIVTPDAGGITVRNAGGERLGNRDCVHMVRPVHGDIGERLRFAAALYRAGVKGFAHGDAGCSLGHFAAVPAVSRCGVFMINRFPVNVIGPVEMCRGGINGECVRRMHARRICRRDVRRHGIRRVRFPAPEYGGGGGTVVFPRPFRISAELDARFSVAQHAADDQVFKDLGIANESSVRKDVIINGIVRIIESVCDGNIDAQAAAEICQGRINEHKAVGAQCANKAPCYNRLAVRVMIIKIQYHRVVRALLGPCADIAAVAALTVFTHRYKSAPCVLGEIRRIVETDSRVLVQEFDGILEVSYGVAAGRSLRTGRNTPGPLHVEQLVFAEFCVIKPLHR